MELNTVHFYHIRDFEKAAHNNKLAFINDFSLYLLVLFFSYDTLIISLFSFQNYKLINNTLGNAITIIAYLLLLCIFYIIVARLKKHNLHNSFLKSLENNENTEIEAIFNIGLLINSVFLISLSIFDSEEIYSAVGLVSFSLYLGFSTSISDILEQKSLAKVLICFLNPLKKIGINKNNCYNIFYVILSIAFLSYITCKWSIWPLAIMGVILLIFIILVKTSRSSYSKSFSFDVADKNILLIQVGENLALRSMAESMIGNPDFNIDINKVENELLDAYDAIIILSPGIKK